MPKWSLTEKGRKEARKIKFHPKLERVFNEIADEEEREAYEQMREDDPNA
jgi:hypothetical protein